MDTEVKVKVNDRYEYIAMLVDWYSVFVVSNEHHLRPREKEFFILTVLGYLDGDKYYHTPKGFKKYSDSFKTRHAVSDYMSKLKAKGWVHIGSRKQVKVPQFFEQITFDGSKLTVIPCLETGSLKS